MLLKDEETAIESGRDLPLIASFLLRERLVLEKRWQLHVPNPSRVATCHNLLKLDSLDRLQTDTYAHP